MADNKDVLNQFRQIVREENEPLKERLDRQDKKLDEQGRDIKSVKQDVSTLQKDVTTLKQDVATVKDVQQMHGEKLDRVEDGQNRQHTVLKTLQGAVEETRAEVDKIRRRPQQAD
jgi:chromosome segregation ATPase